MNEEERALLAMLQNPEQFFSEKSHLAQSFLKGRVVQFQDASTEFMPGDDGTPTLDQVADYLRTHPDVRFVVAGYAHDTEVKDNQALSERRAKAARDYLVSKGISAARLEVVGRVLTGKKPSDPAQSRVVFAVSPRMGRRPSVTVFGAGVSGLTAAQELAERGFDVFVIEKDRGRNAQGEWETRIGGMAMTQYVEGEEFNPQKENISDVPTLPGEHGFRFFPSYYHNLWDTLQRIPLYEQETAPLEKAPLEAKLAEIERDELYELAKDVSRILATPDAKRSSAYRAELKKQWKHVPEFSERLEDGRKKFLKAVRPWLENEKNLYETGLRARVGELKKIANNQKLREDKLKELADAVSRAIEATRRTRLERSARGLLEGAGEDHAALVPRIILEESREGADESRRTPTHRTVYDNVVPCTTLSIIARDRSPFFFARRPTRSSAELMDQGKRILESGFQLSDLNTYAYRMLRYMCTSSARRDAECEGISLTDYLKGRDSAGHERYRYSEEFLEQIEFSPRVLAALDAEYGDARTNLSTLIQILSNNMVEQPKVDGVLNGPTSDAWLNPWRLHLEQLGVKFVLAELLSLERNAKSGDVVAKLDPSRSGWMDQNVWIPLAEQSDYFVVALDAPAAEKVTKPLWEAGAGGVPGKLRDYASKPIKDPRGQGAWPEKDTRDNAYAAAGRAPWDRFQTLTGIQYFFENEFSLVHGHVYFPKADWGLSAICEEDFWIDRPTLRKHGFQGVLSVDIGAWNQKSQVTRKSPAESTKGDIATEVWDQMRRAIRDVESGLKLPDPRWYHLDENIKFGADGTPTENRCPYFIPIMGDFKNRPGGAPWDPASGRANAEEKLDPGVWRAQHGGYWVHWNKLVFAGTYKKTFTRLTTMEAACESGRHAVNAIIDHYLHKQAEERHDPMDPSSTKDYRSGVGSDWSPLPGFTTATFRSPVFTPSALGNYCQIWNIEENELPDLDLAKRADEWCFERGLPHPWEMLGWDNVTALSSSLGMWTSGRNSTLGRIFKLFQGSSLQDALISPLPYAENVLNALQKLRKAIEDLANRPATPPTTTTPPPTKPTTTTTTPTTTATPEATIRAGLLGKRIDFGGDPRKPPGSWSPEPDQEKILDAVRDLLKDAPAGTKLLVHGHAFTQKNPLASRKKVNPTGHRRKVNKDMSERLADAVVAYLAARTPPVQATPLGFGEDSGKPPPGKTFRYVVFELA